MCTCTSDTCEEAGMPCLHTKSHPEMIISKRRSGLVYVSAPSLSHTGKARIVSVYHFVICNMASSLLHNCHLCAYYICVQSHNKAIVFFVSEHACPFCAPFCCNHTFCCNITFWVCLSQWQPYEKSRKKFTSQREGEKAVAFLHTVMVRILKIAHTKFKTMLDVWGNAGHTKSCTVPQLCHHTCEIEAHYCTELCDAATMSHSSTSTNQHVRLCVAKRLSRLLNLRKLESFSKQRCLWLLWFQHLQSKHGV